MSSSTMMAGFWVISGSPSPKSQLDRHRPDTLGVSNCFGRVVRVSALETSREAPSHAVGREQQVAHELQTDRRFLHAEAMKAQIRPLLFDREKDRLDRGRV